MKAGPIAVRKLGDFKRRSRETYKKGSLAKISGVFFSLSVNSEKIVIF